MASQETAGPLCLGESPCPTSQWGLCAQGSKRSYPSPQPLPSPEPPQSPGRPRLFLTSRTASRPILSLHARLPTTFFSNKSAPKTPITATQPATQYGPPNKDCAMPSALGFSVCSSLFRLFLFLRLHFAASRCLCQVTIDSLLSLCSIALASKSRHKLQVDPFLVLCTLSRCVYSVCLRRSLPSHCLPSTVLQQNACLLRPINKTTSWGDSTLSGRGRAIPSCLSMGAVRQRQSREAQPQSCKLSRRRRQKRLKSPSRQPPKKTQPRPSPRQISR